MNDLEIMLLTIGDLEFTRRKLMQRIQELEAESQDLKVGDPTRSSANQPQQSD